MNTLVNLNQDKTITTTSKIIADKFNKEHRNVMVSIRTLLTQMSKEFGEQSFVLSSYVSDQNKVLPCYDITRDGFMMLAMGFTGDKAIQWKEQYITAFNRMEEYLTTNAQAALSVTEQTHQQIALINAQADKAQAEQRLYQIQQTGAFDAVQQALKMAELFNAPIDINDLITRDLGTVPKQIITDLKMQLAPQINQFGTLDMERSSLSHLLDLNAYDMTPTKFNAEVLRPLGMLSTTNEIIGAGLYFGTNDKGSSNTGKTNPRWFNDRFHELLEFVQKHLESKETV